MSGISACSEQPASTPALTSVSTAIPTETGTGQQLQIAFMPDIHFHDIYANFSDGAFAGLPNSQSGKHATIRSMAAQLKSTRLFNENYFALLAALDDAAARDIKLIALPGDFSDDGQPLHIRGLAAILQHYSDTYGMQFFAAPGNHDPVRPFSRPAGKSDYLGINGYEQPIYSPGSDACSAKLPAIQSHTKLSTICSEEVKELGYQEIMAQLAPFGFYPQPGYLYWETPYSNYNEGNYRFSQASEQATYTQRQYEICLQGTGGHYKQPDYSQCSMVPDSSYLVEPVEGLWLLAIDANVYVPQAGDNGNGYTGAGNAGYNRMFSHKTQVTDWITRVVQRAEQAGKTLIAFSHYPMTEFYNGQSAAIAEQFGADSFQLARSPADSVSNMLAATGLKLHIGGHMHINDTGISKSPDGKVLVNVQAPSLAAYVPAYKLVTLKPQQNVEVQTVVLNDIPRYNELFEHYQQEHNTLTQQGRPLWNKAILTAKSYREFTNWHLSELTRQRFLPQDWPAPLRDNLLALNGRQMLVLSQLQSPLQLTQLLAELATLQQSPNWQQAATTAEALVTQAGLAAEDFGSWNGFDLAVDFYRLRNAGSLALQDISPQRLAQYQLLTRLLAAKAETEQGNDSFARQFGGLFQLLQAFRHGDSDMHFRLDLSNGSIHDLSQ
ncbi:3',5'-cyclic AMP phosphodiesterase CpdA [Rheinheimera pacifica]|uniref:metallophosphoesterase family protein n=1 Tax=Rheinheimera pacifica TaxID=173990 RepID=UPI00216A4F6C|nr:metallophosphoesterase [Rheinheimera pacifica]MCS4306189.1 3',5'-cyclic AMP phosphodiesterase CpdA [Rheinheimera pacifica]